MAAPQVVRPSPKTPVELLGKRPVGLHVRRATLRELLATTALVGVCILTPVAAFAGNLPSGGQVVGGSATITTPTSTQMQITSTTARSAIAWQDFSIGSGYGVNVTQPAGGTQLEEVRGTNVSQIFGSLTSNGSIVVANPNGIWFGPNAQVDVAGLAAVAAKPTSADVQSFINGGSLALSQAGNATAAVINQGSITISNAGLAAFVAPGVRNDGVIQARLGTVQLSSGTTATLDFYGDGLVSIAVSGQTLAQAIDPSTGKPLGSAVTNTGTLNADGGTVLVTANVASNVVDDAINTAGVIQARSVSTQNGQIVLDGGSTGAVQVAGSLDASGTGSGQTGGSVKVLGNQVALNAGTAVNVAGDAGGGTALIGSDFHGAGPDRNAQATYADANATIDADAITSGNGGQVAVWSQQATSFDGTVTARGGAQAGNGGFIETSSAGSLKIASTARANTLAPAGKAGTWLIDPTDWTIAPTGGDETGTDVVNSLAGGNLTIQADNDIIVNDAIDATTNTGATNNLTLEAGRNVNLNANITLNGGSLTATANDSTNSVLPGNRGTGAGSIAMAAGTTIDTTIGGGAVSLGLGPSASNPVTPGVNDFTPGTISLAILNAGSVSVSASPTTLNADITTAGGQTYNGAVTLGADVTLSDTADAPIAFNSTLNGSDGVANHALTAIDDAAPSFVGAVSNLANVTLAPNSPSQAIAVGDSSPSGSGTVYDFGAGLAQLEASGALVAGGTVTIGSSTLPTAGDITLEKFNAPWNVALWTNGNISVGVNATLTDGTFTGQGRLDLTANGASGITLSYGNVTTASGQTYWSPTTLVDNTGLTDTASGVIEFKSTLTGGGNSLMIKDDVAPVFDGTVSNFYDFILQPNTATNSVAAGDVLGQPEAVGANTTYDFDPAAGNGLNQLTTAGVVSDVLTIGSQGTSAITGDITMTTFSPAPNLALATGGTVHATGAFNGSGSLNLTGSTGIALGANITTAGGQSYNGAVTLGADTTLTDAGGGTIVFNNALDGASTYSLTVIDDTAPSFTSVTNLINVTLAPNTTGEPVSVGDIFVVPSPTTYDFSTAGLNPLMAAGAINGTLTIGSATTGNIAMYTFSPTVNVAVTAGNGNIWFYGPFNGTGSLALSGSGGGSPPGIVLAANVATAAGQTYNSAVTLASDVTLTDTGAGVDFVGTVDGAHALSVSGNATFNAEVGVGTALNSLYVSGATTINTDAITTTGTQEYGSGVTLLADTNLTGTTVTFDSTVDGSQALTVTGDAAFNGEVGSATNLSSLYVSGATAINTDAITTNNGQTYNSPVTLGAATVLTDNGGGNITFVSTVNGGQTLEINTGGQTTFGGAVGSGTPLASLTIDSGGALTALNGGAITTTGGQTYNSPVTLGVDTTLNDNSATGITFNDTVDGNQALTVNGNATFNGEIGNGTTLAGLSVSGTSAINTDIITTNSSGQTYGGAVTLGQDTTLTDIAVGNIAFNGTIDGTFALTVDTDGAIKFGAIIGRNAPLTGLNLYSYSSGAPTVALTIAAQANSKVYDGTTTAAATPNVTGLVTPDSVSNLAEIYDSSAIGIGITLWVSSFTLDAGHQSYGPVTILANTNGAITASSGPSGSSGNSGSVVQTSRQSQNPGPTNVYGPSLGGSLGTGGGFIPQAGGQIAGADGFGYDYFIEGVFDFANNFLNGTEDLSTGP